MDYKTIWNEICFHVKKNLYSTESDFQTTVEFMLEKLGWSQYKGEIATQITIPVGSSNSVRPDIVIKHDGKIVLVLELKKANTELSARNSEQLFSYMRLLRLNYGVLLGETLQVFCEQLGSNSPVKICDILFSDNSDAGAECIEALSKHDFSFTRLNMFCEKCLSNPEKYLFKLKKITTTNTQSISGNKRNYVSRTIVIDGFDKNKRRPRVYFEEIPEGFTRTGEMRDTILFNGFEAKREIWKMEGSSEKYVIQGKNKFEIFIVIEECENGKLKMDHFYF